VYPGFFATRRLLVLTEGFRNSEAKLLSPEQMLRLSHFGLALVLGVRGASKRWRSATLLARCLLQRKQLIAEVRRRKFPGCNSASRWGSEALLARLTAPAGWY
jgi:hypothetical protein